MNSSKAPQPPSPNDLAHALALYEKARALSTHVKPLDANTAKIIVVTARDAIKEFGNTNQEKKIELERIIEEAEDVLPPATIAELKMRAEGRVIKTLHPKGRRLRTLLYGAVVLLILFVPAAVLLGQLFKGQAGAAFVTPTPTPMRAFEAAAEVVNTPTAVDTAPAFGTSQTPTPTPDGVDAAPSAEPSPAIPAGAVARNTAAQWVRLTYDVEWRVATIQRLANATRLHIEVRNTHAKDEQEFYAFADFPLVIIDGNGGFHKMLQTGDAPEGVRQQNKRWHLQAGRLIRVPVDFAPLGPGDKTGQVVYGAENRADPAKFSLQ